MKKLSIILVAVFALSFNVKDEKKYAVSFTLQEWQLILEVIDQSNAPHLKVRAAQDLLVPILNKQISDTTKK